MRVVRFRDFAPSDTFRSADFASFALGVMLIAVKLILVFNHEFNATRLAVDALHPDTQMRWRIIPHLGTVRATVNAVRLDNGILLAVFAEFRHGITSRLRSSRGITLGKIRDDWR